jgi:ABC-2 type transport system permease protein
MSAIAAATARPLSTRPGLGRLTGVELRKMTDTRAGLWLLIVTAALTLAAVALVCAVGEPPDHRLARLLELALVPSSILLPIVGVLLVSSEWSQRTAMITFALVPQRGRVLVAKLLAGTLLALAAFVLCVAVAAVATAIMAPDVTGAWSLSAGLLFQMLLSVTTGMAMGIGFGAMLLASAPAIVLYFALPIGWSVLGSLSALETAAEWLDGSRSLVPLTSELLSGTQWARAITTLALWMVVPLVVGWWRIRREEVR